MPYALRPLLHIHPWQIDPEQPKVNEASAFYRFRHYVNLKNAYRTENPAPSIQNPVDMNTSYSFTLDKELFESYEKLINPAYPHFLKRLGLDRVAVKAEGATITDSSGKTYIDCIGGYGLFNLGHNHPKIIQALRDQLDEK